MLKKCLLGCVLVFGFAALTACDTAEERSEKHFQAALEHLENGDFERAIVEFRNVFKLNGQHKEARLRFARMQRDRGVLPDAYGQYLRLVEQYPENLEGRKALAEMAIELGDWEEAERHGRAAAEIAPDDLIVQSTLVALSYRDAFIDRDTAGQSQAFQAAQSLLATQPDLTAAHNVVVDKLIQDKAWTKALDALDAALVASPDFYEFYRLRLGVLDHLGEKEAIEEQLISMTERFPSNAEIDALLLTWYVSNERHAAAESYLREKVATAPDDADLRISLVRFLEEHRGSDAALAELSDAIAAGSQQTARYRSLYAAILFQNGDEKGAINELQDVLKGAVPSVETNTTKVTLARILIATGEQAQAQAIIEEVLASDSRHVDAIKLEAGWLIDSDRANDAIALLRVGLGENPRDPELMTLLAYAHERNGDRDLMSEMLSLAVEASGAAPEETLRYAAFLANSDNSMNAEAVLIDALRVQPDNIELLTALGQIYLRMQDWPRTQDVIDRLSEFGQSTLGIANDLTTRMLAGQGNEAALKAFLETTPEDGRAGARTELDLIRFYVSRQDTETALLKVEDALKQRPQDPMLRFVRGSVLALNNRTDEAEAEFSELLQAYPDIEQAWLALYRLKTAQGDTAAADQLLDQALDVLPDSPSLNWAKAGSLERDGKVEDAISIYETLYAQDSNNPLFANNLASLLATHYEDSESLERAYAIARRLRNSSVPAFQDTYGWIAYRRGDFEEALKHLEPAAAGLPTDPMVQYHLAAAHAALDQNAEALELLHSIAGMNAPARLLETVLADIERLQAPKDDEQK